MSRRSLAVDPPADHRGHEGAPVGVDLLYAPLAVLALRHDGALDWFCGYYRVDGRCVLMADWRLYGSMWFALGWRRPAEPTSADMVNLVHPPRDVRDLLRVDFE